MMTKSQFIKKSFIWFIFINMLYSTPYFGLACIVFNIKQSLIIWFITFSIEYNKMIDVDYLDYCIQFKKDNIN